MKASETTILKLIESVRQFYIPVYQRPYSWRLAQCRQLWQDILRAGNLPESGHFVGAIVTVSEGLGTATSPAPLIVIDGQQRLITVMLLLEALARHLPPDYNTVAQFSPAKIRYYFLRHEPESGDARYKLLPSKTDKETFCAIMDQAPMPGMPSEQMQSNFQFFEECLSNCKDSSLLIEGLHKLLVVEIALNSYEDNPQRIFESLNSTGLDLSQADLIRNFLLMGLPAPQQQTLYQDYWWPMESLFGQKAYQERFDLFMRDYLTLRHPTGSIPVIRDIYTTFKAMMAQAEANSVVQSMYHTAVHYGRLALGQEPQPALREVFARIADLVRVAYPFLLEVYADYENNLLQASDLQQIASMVECYVFRRAICGIAPNSLDKTFATFLREKSFDKTQYVESVKAVFLLLTAQRRFPSDVEFREAFMTRQLYKARLATYCLTKLEQHLGKKEPANLAQCTVEHIMPQTLSEAWKRELGAEWERIHETWLHTVGNLTLTGYNSTYSNEIFSAKQDMPDGFRQSMLHLNRSLHEVSQWNEAAIQSRAAYLADIALQVWPMPTLEENRLRGYQQARKSSSYTLEDHPHICGGPMSELFAQLRQCILALSPEVHEEYLKLYIAYKAVTNFVDIVPQKSKLRLSLNMPFEQIDDPRKMSKDVAGVGRWGNGDVEVGLSDAADIPYVMGLIKQSLLLQMEE